MSRTRKYTVYLTKYSARKDDGSRAFIDRQELASSPAKGNAELIARYFRNDIYKELLSESRNEYPVYFIDIE